MPVGIGPSRDVLIDKHLDDFVAKSVRSLLTKLNLLLNRLLVPDSGFLPFGRRGYRRVVLELLLALQIPIICAGAAVDPTFELGLGLLFRGTHPQPLPIVRFSEYRKAIIGEGQGIIQGTLYMNPIPPGMVLKTYIVGEAA